MSSELERQLRDARETLPAPAEQATQRARARAVASLRARRRRTRALVLAAAVVASVVALGITAGSLNAPSVTAAREPAVLGFVPEPGWFALQSPPPAIEGQQTVAVAANVPFAADDVENGLVEPSGLPYSTLVTLPPNGIVIVVAMTPLWDPHLAPVATSSLYPTLELPLQLRNATPREWWGGAQVRPDEPLGQYQLSGEIEGLNADVTVYFGTASPTSRLRAAAQRQLDGFVVRPDRAGAVARPTSLQRPAEVFALVDRTYSCKTVILGGVYEIETRAHAGIRAAQGWSKLPYAVVSSGGWAGLLIGYPYARDNSLAWITAGRPTHDTTADVEGESFPVQTGGTLGVNRSLCKPARARVPLGHAGLSGGVAGEDGRVFDCSGLRRVLVRIRATTLASASLSRRGAMLVASNAVVRHGELAVRTDAGRLLAYAEVSDTGRSRLFTARGCTRE
jgi:hypothetical protein